MGDVFTLQPDTIAHCASNWYWFDPFCWATGNSQSDFERLALPKVGVPPAPTAAQLTEPADQAVQELVNAQAAAQQTANAQQVDTSVGGDILGAAGAAVSGAESAAAAIPWVAVGIAGIAAVVLMSLSRGRR